MASYAARCDPCIRQARASPAPKLSSAGACPAWRRASFRRRRATSRRGTSCTRPVRTVEGRALRGDSVAAMWPTLEVIRDIYSQASVGVVLTWVGPCGTPRRRSGLGGVQASRRSRSRRPMTRTRHRRRDVPPRVDLVSGWRSRSVPVSLASDANSEYVDANARLFVKTARRRRATGDRAHALGPGEWSLVPFGFKRRPSRRNPARSGTWAWSDRDGRARSQRSPDEARYEP